jgi:hypothetical protein
MKTTKQNKDKGLKSRSELINTEKKVDGAGAPTGRNGEHCSIDFEQRRKNRLLETDKVLALLSQALPEIGQWAMVIGKWVWVVFSEAPAPEVRAQLAQLGFHWNRKRQSWQHPCGLFRSGSKADPRSKYQTKGFVQAAAN